MARITDFMLLQQAEQPALIIEATTNMAGLPNVLGESFMKIGKYLEDKGELTTDAPFVIYHNFANMTEQHIGMTIGFKTAKPLASQNEIKSVTLPAQKIAVGFHRGTYEELAGFYCEMMEWIKSNGQEATGDSIEYYLTNPNTPESETVTKVEMPLK
jgi:effector-binding domain-containing protein